MLTAYRRGDVEHLLALFTHSATVAAIEARSSAERLREFEQEWRAAMAPVRRGSAVAELLEVLTIHPVLSSADAEQLIDAPRSSVFAAIARAEVAGVLRPLTNRKRNQIWGADAVLSEVEDLSARIARRVATDDARPDPGADLDG